MASVIRLGLIGAGRWGHTYLRTFAGLADRCRVTHVCTSRPDRVAVPAGAAVVADWHALLRADCDAVIVATPPHTHAEILEACLEVRKPCLMEKPLCLDAATADRLHDRVQASGVPVLVDHTQVFHPGYRALKHALTEAREPIRVIFSEGMALGPFRAHTPALWDWAPHDVSLCLDLLGAQPQRCDALAGPAGPDGAPEHVSLRLEFAGGVAAWIHAGRLAPQRRRVLSVITETRLYVLEDAAAQPLTVSPLRWAARYTDGIPEPLERRPIPLPAAQPPLACVVTSFLDGLAGGDRAMFGTTLARDVVTVLSRCEAAMSRGAIRHEPHSVS